VIERDKVLKRIQEIPDLPTSATKVLRMAEDPEVRTEELVRVIEYDPSLSVNVLRLANSAYFGRPKSVSSVREAIVRLGMKNIVRMVLSCAAAPIQKPEVAGYGLRSGELWEHSVAVAVAAETLAKVLAKQVPEYTFTAGLLHDVGKIALGTFVEEYLTRMQMYALENKVPFEEAERTIIGMDHAEAGAILLEQWSLPSCMINVVRWHQEPDRAPVQDLVIDLVHAADALMLSGGVGAGNDGLNYRLSRSVVSRLGVTIHVAEAVVCMTMSAVEELKDSFLGGSGR